MTCPENMSFGVAVLDSVRLFKIREGRELQKCSWHKILQETEMSLRRAGHRISWTQSIAVRDRSITQIFQEKHSSPKAFPVKFTVE